MDKVEIDGDTADRIVICSLKDSIKTLRADIKKYGSKKKPSKWEKDELVDCLQSLEHLEKTFDYYGGNLNDR